MSAQLGPAPTVFRGRPAAVIALAQLLFALDDDRKDDRKSERPALDRRAATTPVGGAH